LKKRRHDAWNWKNKLSKLEARKAVLKSTDLTEAGFDIPNALKATQKYLRELEDANIDGVKVSPALTVALEGRIAEVNAEVKRLEEEISSLKKKLDDQFTDMKKYEYQLRAVFIHRGQMGGGHYWIYLYDAKNDVWRKYNDEHVSRVVDRNRVFSPQNFDDGTPYFLGYVKSSAATDLVDAVVRDVQPKSTQMDVSMDDSEEAPAANVRHVEFATPKPIAPKELPGKSFYLWIFSLVMVLECVHCGSGTACEYLFFQGMQGCPRSYRHFANQDKQDGLRLEAHAHPGIQTSSGQIPRL